MSWVYIIDIIGTLVFAISGVLTAIRHKFDLVGSIIIGLVTAVGGGSLRDVLIGQAPVGWMNDLNYLYTILAAVVLTYVFKKKIMRLPKSMFLFDTLGLGLFTILGVQKTLGVGLSIPIALLMGAVTAAFGGVIRDVLTNEVPLIFRKEVYASACILGGLVFVLLELISVYNNINMVFSMLTVMFVRYQSVKRGWSLHIKKVH